MKFYGYIGYVYEKETAPGVWKNISEEHQAYGDVLTNSRQWITDSDVNDDLNVTNKISVVADGFLCDHLGSMKYIVWQGVKWKIKTVELNRPRAVLTLGGVYNG